MKFPLVLSRMACLGSFPTSITPLASTPCRYGLITAIAAAGPASAMSNCPACATGVDPKTGEERYVAWCEERREVRSEQREGEIVVVSTIVLPFNVSGGMDVSRFWTAESSLS